MMGAVDSIALFAELSLVLAGFAGVVSAFAGRDRQFRPVELARLIHVLSCSATILVGCLAFATLSAGGYSEKASLGFAGVSSSVLSAVLLLPLTVRGVRNARDPQATTESWVLVVMPAICVFVIVLFGLAPFVERPLYPLVGGFSTQLLVGLWLFSRLLTRPN